MRNFVYDATCGLESLDVQVAGLEELPYFFQLLGEVGRKLAVLVF